MMAKLVRYLILVGSLMWLVAFTGQLKDAYFPFKKLKIIQGVIENKFITIDSGERISKSFLHIQLRNDQNDYRLSKHVVYVNDKLQTGDAVLLFIRPGISAFGNFITNEDGSSISTTHDPNEIFHMINRKDNEIFTDFFEYQRQLRKMLWIFPLCSVIFFGFYLYLNARMKKSLKQ